MRRILTAIVVVTAGMVVFVASAEAVTFIQGASLSSSDYRVLDSQHAGFKASSSSDSYQLLGTVGDVAIGSSSGGGFGLRSGFLYYPLLIAPALTSATAGSGDVDLVWDAATMEGGWTVSGYNVCTKPSAGSYACEDVGNVTSFTKAGLSNGTTYTFKIQAKEAFGDVIAESDELSATPAGSGGGGGGGGGYVQQGGVDIEGYAHPGSTVTILRDGVIVDTVIADDDGTFDYDDRDLSAGTYIFGFWAEDLDGRRSVVLSIPVTISQSRKNVRNIILSPTIALVGPNSISSGAPISLFGRATPTGQVRIRLSPTGQEYLTSAGPLGDGRFSYDVPTSGLADGVYEVSVRTELLPGVGVSSYSQLLPVGIGVPAPQGCANPPDINRDTRVNLVDFSVLAYWWKRVPLPAYRPFDLNCDNQVRLDDFSILAFHWSG